MSRVLRGIVFGDWGYPTYCCRPLTSRTLSLLPDVLWPWAEPDGSSSRPIQQPRLASCRSLQKSRLHNVDRENGTERLALGCHWPQVGFYVVEADRPDFVMAGFTAPRSHHPFHALLWHVQVKLYGHCLPRWRSISFLPFEHWRSERLHEAGGVAGTGSCFCFFAAGVPGAASGGAGGTLAGAPAAVSRGFLGF